jgi:16S rRNA (cytidine1402-2'-O)-methyltransferase
MTAAGSGTLSVVATPIGNLEDLSLRAARILREADLIAAEDTRSARVLLRHVDAVVGASSGGAAPADADDAAGDHRRRVISLFEHNEVARTGEVLAAIAAGQKVALISEAGTPGVSDPGARVIRAAIDAGVRIEVVPGPVAAIAALVASGLPSDRFLFVGFPPREAGARQALFGTLRGERGTLIFYEAPDRVAATCADLAAALGVDRPACLSRELTKIYEEHVRAPVGELASRYAEVSPRGECTLCVAGATEAPPAVDIEGELRRLLGEGLGPRDAAARLVVVTGKPRRQLYQLALAVARERTPGAEPDPGEGEP